MSAKIRLSSDFLYTYTPKLETIKLILQNGLRHSLQEERILPPVDIKVQNFTVCFCDILPEDSGFHKSIYGNYAIAFNKSWGIDKGITPIRYIHKNSQGVGEEYFKLKNDLRKARITQNQHGSIDYWHDIVFFQQARERGILTAFDVDLQTRTKEFIAFIDEFEKEYEDIVGAIPRSELMIIFNNWILPIIHSLDLTINELERRDSLLRAYQDNFRSVKNKVLYDEREWRSVKYIDELTLKTQPDLFNQAMKNGFLPPKYNLRFNGSDIFAIIVESSSDKDEIIDFIKSTSLPYLIGVEKHVMTFDEHLKL